MHFSQYHAALISWAGVTRRWRLLPHDYYIHTAHGHAEVLVAKTNVCLNIDLNTLTENLPNPACPSYFMKTHVFDRVVFHRQYYNFYDSSLQTLCF